MNNVKRLVVFIVMAAVAAACLVSVEEAHAYPKLSKKQVRIAQRNVPRRAAKWAPLVNKYFSKYLWKVRHRKLRRNELRHLLWVIWRESRGNWRCVYRGHYGLFQVSGGHFRGRNRLRPVSNVATAAMLYARLGWRPWAATW